MKKIPLLGAIFVAIVFASSAFAAGYGAAGCGWGGKVIPKNDILAQLGATMLNGFSSNQTFAMSSGTSGCKKAFKTAQIEQNQFVENNYDNLAKEMAAGKGENLSALAGLMGCPAEQVGGFASFTQEHYASIFANDATTPTEMLTALKRELSSSPELAAMCPKL